MKKILTLFFMAILSQAYSQVDLENGLVAFYPFCGNFSDLSNNNNDGIPEGVSLTTDRLGNPNRACYFNGIDNYLHVPSSPSLEGIVEELSISLWFNTRAYDITNNIWAPLLCKSDILDPVPPTRQFSLFYHKDGTIYFNDEPIVNHQFELNVWYNLVVTYSDFELRCFINGMFMGQAPSVGIATNQLQLDIGRDVPTFPEIYDGVMDDIRIYDRVLNTEEITFLSTDNHDCNATSNEDIEPAKNFSVTPNPFYEGFRIELPRTLYEEVVIRVYDATGNQIINKEYSSMGLTEVSTSNLTPGVYFISITTEKWDVTKKIIKANR